MTSYAKWRHRRVWYQNVSSKKCYQNVEALSSSGAPRKIFGPKTSNFLIFKNFSKKLTFFRTEDRYRLTAFKRHNPDPNGVLWCHNGSYRCGQFFCIPLLKICTIYDIIQTLTVDDVIAIMTSWLILVSKVAHSNCTSYAKDRLKKSFFYQKLWPQITFIKMLQNVTICDGVTMWQVWRKFFAVKVALLDGEYNAKDRKALSLSVPELFPNICFQIRDLGGFLDRFLDHVWRSITPEGKDPNWVSYFYNKVWT